MGTADLKPQGGTGEVRLWNPNAAAIWSFFLSPALGAYLHASNWKTLGKPELAKQSMYWFWAVIAYLVAALGTIFVADSTPIDSFLRLAGFPILIGWHVASGRHQIAYVKENFGKDYQRRGWSGPILLYFAALSVYVAVGIGLIDKFTKPGPADVASAVKPMILKKWSGDARMHDATIDDIELKPAGEGTYHGFMDATAEGEHKHYTVDVTVDKKNVTVRWSNVKSVNSHS